MSAHGGWTHDAAFRALWALNGGSRTKAGAYAFLYPQRPNSAVLYQDGAPHSGVRSGPLHLRPESPSARPQLFAALGAYTALSRSENRESKPSGFDWYAVTDWDGFARVVGLPPSPAAPPQHMAGGEGEGAGRQDAGSEVESLRAEVEALRAEMEARRASSPPQHMTGGEGEGAGRQDAGSEVESLRAEVEALRAEMEAGRASSPPQHMTGGEGEGAGQQDESEVELLRAEVEALRAEMEARRASSPPTPSQQDQEQEQKKPLPPHRDGGTDAAPTETPSDRDDPGPVGIIGGCLVLIVVALLLAFVFVSCAPSWAQPWTSGGCEDLQSRWRSSDSGPLINGFRGVYESNQEIMDRNGFNTFAELVRAKENCRADGYTGPWRRGGPYPD